MKPPETKVIVFQYYTRYDPPRVSVIEYGWLGTAKYSDILYSKLWYSDMLAAQYNSLDHHQHFY